MASVGSTSYLGAPLPSNGTAGQILAKNSDRDFDTAWMTLTAMATGPQALHSTGQYYASAPISGRDTSPAVTIAAGQVMYVPFYVQASVTIDAIGSYITTAPSAVTQRLALLSANPTTRAPGDLLGTVRDIQPTVVGSANRALLTPVAITAGWYYLAVGTTAALTIAGASSTVVWSPVPNFTSTGSTMSGAPGIGCNCFQLDNVAGVIAANPAATAVSAAAVPVLWYRIG